MGISDLPVGRRDLSRLVAGVAAAAGITSAAARTATAGPPTIGRRRELRLHPDGVAALDLPLADVAGVARGTGVVRTPVIETTTFTALGVTWRHGGGRVRARWRRTSGGWTEWRLLPRLGHGPDPGSPEALGAVPATDLVWVGPSDAVQVEVTGDQRDPVLALLRPHRRVRDAAPWLATSRRAAPREGAVPMPNLLHRRAWGARARLRNGEPTYNRRIRQVHIHHTVNSNHYRRADVPAMIRAMYRYHTQSLGWSDIGYNFLVDRFGRLWVGRAGGPRRAVRGAHTLGFNHASVGVAAIGNFETASVGLPMVRALVRIASWKLDMYGGHPRRRIWIRSHGSDLFPDGEMVRLPTIDGHRDTNQTACPGRNLYAVLPMVRRRTARRIRAFRQS